MTTSMQAWLDQEDKQVATTIRRFGCHISYVFGRCAECADHPPRDDDDVPFACSTGFFGLGHPVLLIYSVGQATAAGVINHLFAQVRAGRDLVPGELVSFERSQHRVVVEEVPNPEEIALATQRHHLKPPFDPVPLLQLTYDDQAGRFPWDAGHADDPRFQPRPGTFQA